jgi:uncharacterized protein YndB with AHSA1/START domain
MSRSIEREIRVEATPEVVYEVVSSPEHLREWWPDEADVTAVPGSTGTVSFGDKVVALTVVEATPPRRFSFRWDYEGAVATPENSLLVTFDLEPAGSGTLLRFSETGFDAAARPDEVYQDHVSGWNHFLPRLAPYGERL